MTKGTAGYAVWCAVTFMATAAGADEAAPRFADIVVTATRTETAADDVTRTVTVLPGAQIEQRAQSAAAEALRGAPGVDLTAFGSPGRSAFASIRGAAPDQVLVLLDGVEVNTPTVGQFDFGNLTTDDVGRIEVLRGAGGALYGSQAIGGVINVLTARGDGPLRFTWGAEGGRASSHREQFSVAGGRGPVGISGAVSYQGTNGFQGPHDDARNVSTVWRADADLVPAGTARTIVRYTNARSDLPNFNVADGRRDADAYSRTDFVLLKGEWEHVPVDALSYRLSTSYVRDNLRYRDEETDDGGRTEPVVVARFPSEIVGAQAQANYALAAVALTTIGLDFKELSADLYKQRREVEDDGEVETEVDRLRPNRSNVGVYGQEQVRLLEDTLLATGGVRYDHYDDVGDEVTWSGSGSYLVRPTQTRLLVSYAQGFRAPSFDELFEPELGNPNLDPERSWEIDAGVSQSLFDGQLRVEPTYFYRDVSNLIEEVADQLPPINIPEEDEQEGPFTRNLDARFQGVELVTRVQPYAWLTVSGSYMYLDYDTPTGVLLQRPKHRGFFGIDTMRAGVLRSGDRGWATVQVYAVGARDSPDPQDEFEAERLGGYVRTDLSLGYRFGGTFAPVTLTAAVRNLFNEQYEESIGFPAPPAWFLVGLRYHL